MKKKIIEESSSDDDAIEQAIRWSQVEKNDQRKSNHDERRKEKLSKNRKWGSVDTLINKEIKRKYENEKRYNNLIDEEKNRIKHSASILSDHNFNQRKLYKPKSEKNLTTMSRREKDAYFSETYE